ncbi:glycosyltransferase family 4 protein [Algoriphagus litoralis]|uniref:glycosyltransferase family 4 protein n=1 Tax=Algoriphagus litoralis TaxID=2202829 RepID=UPI000DB9C2A0|nr:glycosyltransferase family 4 protein [Algoriphagus litoralis]
MAKIAILHELLGRSKGGIEAWIFHCSEELVRQGHKVVLIHTMGDNIPDDAAPRDVETVSLDTSKVRPSVFFLRSVFSYKKQLTGVLGLYDQVWSRSFGMAWAASRLVKEKSIYINAAPYSYYTYRSIWSLLRRARSVKDIRIAISSQFSYIVAWYFEKNAIQSSVNIFLSKKRKDHTLNFFKLNESRMKVGVVPAGVDYNRFHPRTSSTDILANSVFNIISVCRIDKLKNIQCVIRAVKILTDEGHSINYSIVGDGAYQVELLKLVEDLTLKEFVSFEGKQKNVERWYQNSHLFVLPSLYEGFGSVYIEAMSCGLPCIAISNSSGEFSVASDEIISHGLNGYLMTKNSEHELANYIRNLMVNRKLLAQFGVSARETVLREFTWERTISQILESIKVNEN